MSLVKRTWLLMCDLGPLGDRMGFAVKRQINIVSFIGIRIKVDGGIISVKGTAQEVLDNDELHHEYLAI